MWCSFACVERRVACAPVACSEYEAHVFVSTRLALQTLALSMLSMSACGSRAIDATPAGAARGFIEAMRRVDDPHAREEAYLLLCPPAQIALGLRARNAAALGGRMFAPWEMIAEDRALARHVPRRSGAYRERPIEGDAERRAVDIFNERGEVQSVPVLLVSGGWCVELDADAVP